MIVVPYNMGNWSGAIRKPYLPRSVLYSRREFQFPTVPRVATWTSFLLGLQLAVRVE